MVMIALIGVLLAGASYNHAKGVSEARANPPAGRLVNIGDRRLHLHCQGSGGATVILDAGAGAWSLMMGRLHAQLRDSVRVCSYDRAGLGWSDPSDAGDVGALAEDLRRLIVAGEIPRPVILVGHSLGANIAQVYAATYPEDLQGVLLLDPGRHDDMMEDFHDGDSAAMRIDGCGWRCGAGAAAQRLGVIRLATRNVGKKNYTPDEAREYRMGLRRPPHLPTSLATLAFLPKSAVQTRNARDFGDVPVTVMYSENTRGPSGKETTEDVARWHAATLDSMRVLAGGSSRGRGPVVLPGVTHVTMVLEERARGMIAAEVLRLSRER
jgi:pimeloyl-ACP methyl ester carboxylesterase